MSEGSWQRPGDREAYRRNHERIFGPFKPKTERDRFLDRIYDDQDGRTMFITTPGRTEWHDEDGNVIAVEDGDGFRVVGGHEQAVL